MSFTSSQYRTIEITEKVASAFSVIGAVFIITTFLTNSKFRKAINRLVFYASWGNLFANVATLISRSGVKLGVDSPLCQFQGLLIQWFLPADVLWTFAMACNVYLSFFHQFDAAQLRAIEWKYLILCYGLPFIPALVLLFVNTPTRGKVYGDAVLWCWISGKWDALRIATFYGPAWLVNLVTMFIYVKVGLVVFRWRSQLLSSDHADTLMGEQNSQNFPEDSARQPRYGVTITSQVPHTPSHKRELSSPRSAYAEDGITTGPTQARYPPIQEESFDGRQTTVVVNSPPRVARVDANRATMSYCKTAMLFFLALLCTWVPSTINRVYTLARPDEPVYGLNFASGLVLPLQGFWNTVINIMTSLPACKALWVDLTYRFRRRGSDMNMPMSLGLSKNTHQSLPSRDARADIVMILDSKTRVVHHDSRREQDDRTSRFTEHDAVYGRAS